MLPGAVSEASSRSWEVVTDLGNAARAIDWDETAQDACIAGATADIPCFPNSPPLEPDSNTSSPRYDEINTSSVAFVDDGTNIQLVKRSYFPTQSDELAVEIGEHIRVLRLYDDMWCFCENMTGRQGVIPYDCLEHLPPAETETCPPYDPRRAPPTRTVENGSLGAPWTQWEEQALRGRHYRERGFGVDAAVCVVARTFVTTLVDELEVKIGDGILVLQSYGDKWCLARNVSSGQMGVMPNQCLIACCALDAPETPPATPPLPYSLRQCEAITQ